jgi:hypothetical protein
MTTLALINNQTMICENVSFDERPASEINITGYTVLGLSTTRCFGWVLNTDLNEYEIVEKNLGEGGVGDTWNGEYLLSEKPITITETTF